MSPPAVEYKILNAADAARLNAAAAKPVFPKHDLVEEFQRRVHEYFTGYVFSQKGMELVVNSLPEPNGPEQHITIGVGPPENGVALARLNYNEVRRDASLEGAYLDRIAKSLLVLVYAEWDEVTRARVAESFGVKTKMVTSDLMGDLRHVRNWIVHNKSVVDKNAGKLKLLNWGLEVGQVLTVNKERMEVFMRQINHMLVQIDLENEQDN